AIYRGSTISELSLVASNDDDPNVGATSRASFNVRPTEIFNIAVDGASIVPGGATGSIKLRLELHEPPRISIQPQDRQVAAGTNVLFTVIASGEPPLSYQWRRNGVNIPG